MAEPHSTAGVAAPHNEITVGPAGADVVGATGRVIQIAVDAVAQRGGGTVRVLPGEYLLEDSIRLRPHIALVGDRDKTVLRRAPLVWSRLALDADTGQSEITPEDASAFHPGMGVCLWDERQGWFLGSTPRRVNDIRDGVLHLDDFLRGERYAAAGGIVVNYFPLVLGMNADGCTVDGLTADAQVDDPDGVLDRLRSAAVYLFHCERATVRNVLARRARGDGICFGKASVGTTVEDCETAENTWYGIHPGSHSARSTVRRCHIHHNGSDGLYVCWGIHHSAFEDNHIHHNGWRMLRSGISIGHKDADNLLARNHIHDNAKFGVCVRRKTEGNGAHRCTYRENVIENNGSRPDQLADVKAQIEPWEAVGCAVSVSGVTKDLVFENNTIRETRTGPERAQQHAFCLRAGARHITIRDNRIEGHPEAAIVDESGSGDHDIQKV